MPITNGYKKWYRVQNGIPNKVRRFEARDPLSVVVTRRDDFAALLHNCLRDHTDEITEVQWNSFAWSTMPSGYDWTGAHMYITDQDTDYEDNFYDCVSKLTDMAYWIAGGRQVMPDWSTDIEWLRQFRFFRWIEENDEHMIWVDLDGAPEENEVQHQIHRPSTGGLRMPRYSISTADIRRTQAQAIEELSRRNELLDEINAVPQSPRR